MSNERKIQEYKTLKKLIERIRDDLNNSNFVLIYAYNGTGKTRLSMEFKEKGKKLDKRDTYHFNMLRSVLEKTATFFGSDTFSYCIHGLEDEVLYARAINLLSHGNYSIYEPREMVSDTKDLFKRILYEFLDRYKFVLPEIFKKETTPSKGREVQKNV